jgi:hypothetical protein
MGAGVSTGCGVFHRHISNMSDKVMQEFTHFLCRVCSVLSNVRANLRSRYKTVPAKGPERVFKRMGPLAAAFAAASLREAPFSLY